MAAPIRVPSRTVMVTSFILMGLLGAVILASAMTTFKVVRMAKRGDKLPAEFRQEWLERHRELKRAASKVVAAVAHDSNKDAEYSGMSSMYYSSAAEARAALGDDPAKLEVACEEQVI